MKQDYFIFEVKMKTRQELLDFLKSLRIETKTFDHEPLFTVEESRAVKTQINGAHSKNLFLKDKKSKIYAIITLAESIIDLKKLHEIIGASGRLSFGSEEQLLSLWGVRPGSVTPFGAINDVNGEVTVILDAALMAHEILNFHPLENTATTSIKREDLVTFLKATGHEPQTILVSML